MTDSRETVANYMRPLDAGDLDGILRLFAAEGRVHSPVLGEMPAREFFPKVFASTSESNITPLDIFVSASGSPQAIAHFNYEWFLSDGTRLEFQAADVFKFNPDGKVSSLYIIYDSYPLRETLEAHNYGAD